MNDIKEAVLAQDGGGSPVLAAAAGFNPGYLSVKRSIDLAGALLIGLALLPLMLVLAVLVAMDGGSPFYTQERLGQHGRTFRIWKFRTMVLDAETRLADLLARDPEARREWTHTQKLKKDPRITPVGGFLRRYSLDELPQLWNVLIGDMSLVGPRPMFEEQRVLYPGTAYFALRPGMTGMWQVSKRNASAFAERSRFDNEYAQLLSFRTDFTILMKTVGVVFRGTGY
ncbi:sugar transferase [Lutibaculum baratangense]|uniref:Undecaprenyl-phosphate galactosephosphotransferase n=1 Tax=Lutibaculum baratangense AMV1 TaxID=631454 RepID=V4RA56_9HYPH|nr:sugar transferase [Lutibaculum baratangense]ESR23051.1 Undecaprenyl-phosphate galactosephosphotransferase [Lutibaculum baratangense AMV1]